MSDTCRVPPEEPAVVKCLKTGGGYCARCLDNGAKCPDPKAYCKFRSSCVIHFRAKEDSRKEETA